MAVKNGCYCLLIGFFMTSINGDMEFSITRTWDNLACTDHAPTVLHLSRSSEDTLLLTIRAPFFNSPQNPGGEPGKPFHKLWDYEVVEAFFLGADEKYLEVEFSPHGQHLLLFLSGRKNAIKMCLPVEYTACIEGDGGWTGSARIPLAYFPPGVHLFNAYAIHGSGEERQYEALFPVPTGHFTHPDFHRLEFFKHFDFSGVLGTNNLESDVWTSALRNQGDELKCEE